MDPAQKPETPNPAPVMDIQPPQPIQAPVVESPVVRDTPTNVSDALPANKPEPAEATPLVAQATAATAKHKAPIGAVIAAVIIAVALAVISVVAYMNTSDKDDKAATNTNSQTTNQPAKETITTSDVDTATKDIDDNLSTVDDGADFDTNSLSDSALSL